MMTTTEVCAEMSANVWKVLVEPGDEVSEFDTVVILESMKMEIPVYAGARGKITEVLVTKNQTIDEGAPIVRVSTD